MLVPPWGGGGCLLSNMFFMGEGHASSVIYNLLGKVAPDCPKAILQRKVKLWPLADNTHCTNKRSSLSWKGNFGKATTAATVVHPLIILYSITYVSHGKRHIGCSLGEFQMRNFHHSNRWATQPENSDEPFVSSILLGLYHLVIIDLIITNNIELILQLPSSPWR